MTVLLVLVLVLAGLCGALAFGARAWTTETGRRRLRRLGNVAAGGAVLVVLALAAVPAIGHLTGDFRILPVLSGSMEPEMARGDAAWVRSKPLEDLAVGDVLVFDPPTEEGTEGDRTTIHRVIELVPPSEVAPTDRQDDAVYVRTQGDANDVEDPWVAAVTQDQVWVHSSTIPEIGTVLTAAGSSNARLLGMVVAAVLIASWGVRTIASQETKDEAARRLARHQAGEAWLLVASGETTTAEGTKTIEVAAPPPDTPPSAPKQAARKASKPAAVVMTAIAIVLGGAMFASSASVSDTEELNATLDTGVVALETGSSTLAVGVSDLLPGDSAQQLLSLSHVGDIELLGADGGGDVGLQLLLEGDGSPLVTDTSGGLQLGVERCSQAWTLGPNDPQGRPTYSCAGTLDVVTLARPVLGTVDLPNPPFESYVPGGEDFVRLTLSLPETAPPAMAGATTEVDITIVALQREGRNR